MLHWEKGQVESQGVFYGIFLKDGKFTRRKISKASTVEPIFNDISNSDNCCYNDRFANPSHTICFYDNKYEKSLSSVITTTRSENLGVKQKETQQDFT